MNTYNIQLDNKTSFEQYQMAIKVLKAIGIGIENSPYDITEEELPHYHEEVKNIRENHIKGTSKSYNWNEIKTKILTSKK